ncbi:SGNH/GDSL hydrolase family protein [Pendulispora rubella]|uniref:SGNH/GDSL hydrolase family protein n=1 Tax=Pendulispora rubella TaxID=2741070 RepID=A0ABZ2L9V3_9BACT
MKRTSLLALLAIVCTLDTGVVSASAEPAAGHRVAVWAPSMTTGGPAFNHQTIRMVAHTSTGGAGLRIHLSNLRGTIPLSVGAVSIGLQEQGATAVAGSLRTVRFRARESVTLAAGTEVISDPIPMAVDTEQNVLVSVYLPDPTGSATLHSSAFETTYLSGDGDHSTEEGASSYGTTRTSWYFLSGLDVLPFQARGTVVAFGDSITDGSSTPTGANRRWPDDLARRLAGDHPMAVVNSGIGGNRVLTDSPNLRQGIRALARFDHDALAVPGVRDIILMEGINDIGNNAGPNGSPITAPALIDGYLTLIAKAHAAGVRILGGTMLPYKGARYYSDTGELVRQEANAWIRTSGAFDGIIDFDAAIRDPQDPAVMQSRFDSGDHLHPNATGMQAMADAVDLALLQ